jgi:diguanylate cyclase (GGDEF)-like protein
MSISVGVAHAPRHAAELRRLYVAADAALYDAKRAGRDRVRVAAPAG